MKTLFTLFSVLIITTTNSYALIDSMQVQGQGTIYYLRFIKVYDATLLTSKNVDPVDVLSPDVSKCLKLEYDVSLTSENFIEGANTVLSRQHPAEKLEALQEEIQTLHNSYRPVDKGDSYQLCYNGDKATTTLSLNGVDLVTITSREFSSLYFGIWLSSNNPIDKSLQRDLVSSNG